MCLLFCMVCCMYIGFALYRFVLYVCMIIALFLYYLYFNVYLICRPPPRPYIYLWSVFISWALLYGFCCCWWYGRLLVCLTWCLFYLICFISDVLFLFWFRCWFVFVVLLLLCCVCRCVLCVAFMCCVVYVCFWCYVLYVGVLFSFVCLFLYIYTIYIHT